MNRGVRSNMAAKVKQGLGYHYVNNVADHGLCMKVKQSWRWSCELVWRWSWFRRKFFYSAKWTWMYTQLRCNKFKRRIGWKDVTSWMVRIGLNVYFNRIGLCHRSNWFLDLIGSIGFMCRLHSRLADRAKINRPSTRHAAKGRLVPSLESKIDMGSAAKDI